MKPALRAALATAGVALFLAGTACSQVSLGNWYPQQPVPIGTIVPNLSLGYWQMTPAVDLGRFVSGAFVIRAEMPAAADSVVLDSLAMEAFVFCDTASAGTLANVNTDSDDSDGPKFDGWFLTSMDSSDCALPQNLTPLDQSVPGRFPYSVSSRILSCRLKRTWGGAPIPGAAAVRYGGSATSTSRAWRIPLTDGFGGRLYGFRRVAIGILWRHPRKAAPLSVTFMPSAN